MPYRHYVPGHEPPSLGDRILAHPYVTVLGLMSVFLGSWVITGALTGFMVSRALEDSPPIGRVVAGIPLVIGGAIALYSVIRYKDRLTRLKAMEVERSAVTILAFAWAAYAISLILGGLDRIPPGALIASSLSAAFLLGALSLWVSERRIRRKVMEAREESGD